MVQSAPKRSEVLYHRLFRVTSASLTRIEVPCYSLTTGRSIPDSTRYLEYALYFPVAIASFESRSFPVHQSHEISHGQHYFVYEAMQALMLIATFLPPTSRNPDKHGFHASISKHLCTSCDTCMPRNVATSLHGTVRSFINPEFGF